MTLAGALSYIEVVLGALLVLFVLLQQTGATLGGAFGGDNFSAAYHTRRGMEKWLLWATVATGVLFALTAIAILLVR